MERLEELLKNSQTTRRSEGVTEGPSSHSLQSIRNRSALNASPWLPFPLLSLSPLQKIQIFHF